MEPTWSMSTLISKGTQPTSTGYCPPILPTLPIGVTPTSPTVIRMKPQPASTNPDDRYRTGFMGRLRPRLSAEGGFTLVETLVTMLVLLVMLAAIQRVLFAGFTTFMFGQDNYESQASVELAHKYLDRSLREARSVVAADPKGSYVAVLTDADNDGKDELMLYFVDYGDGKLKEYTKEYTTTDSYDPETSYDFSTPSGREAAGLVETDIIANIVSNEPTTNQTDTLSPNPSHSGRPFIFFGDYSNWALDYLDEEREHEDGWESQIKGLRTYFYVDVAPSQGADAYSLQTYIKFRNIN